MASPAIPSSPQHVALPSIPGTVGALLVGWGLSCLVLGFVYLQTWTYFARYPNDGPYYKCLVASLFILDNVHQAFIGHTAWYYNVTNFGNAGTFFSTPVWTLSMQVFLGAFVGAIVKTCYALRVWKFSNGNVFVTLLIVRKVPPLQAIEQAFLTASFLTSFHTILVNAATLRTLATSSLALGAVADTITALALSYFLHKLRTGYSRSVILLMLSSVNTGALTSFVSLAVVILYNVTPMNFVFMAVYFVLVKRE
ncbi:hypothetical protein K488DRAFT_90466 [Vararia minispora EC-137]|uniref:Uncharacterized protein n=1 Tax=Vararia minispora EC-137 TaxID=1314806 RepID=A0ACB8Q7V9_9AGAM|nr:hypothetical protein K488DRAFT_90466 [Vararia minispora EC-137]